LVLTLLIAALSALLVQAHVALRHVVCSAQQPKRAKEAVRAAAAAIGAHKCTLLPGLHEVGGTKRHLTNLRRLIWPAAAKVALAVADRATKRTVAKSASAAKAARGPRSKAAGAATPRHTSTLVETTASLIESATLIEPATLSELSNRR
jgi:hypothetical protein